jgi:hypothetical protein
MSMPDYSNELAHAQFQFYKSAGRLANLWFILTIIGLILTVLSLIVSCVGIILGASTFIATINSLMKSFPTF